MGLFDKIFEKMILMSMSKKNKSKLFSAIDTINAMPEEKKKAFVDSNKEIMKSLEELNEKLEKMIDK
jgi:hypothetical protein